MSTPILEEHVAALENGVSRLKQEPTTETPRNSLTWWKRIRGYFKADMEYMLAMREGQEYPAAQHPTDDENTA